MTRARRLAILALLLWCLTGVLAWLLVEPGAKLVSSRQPTAQVRHYVALQKPNLEDALDILGKIPLWGLQRDGQPFPPKQAIMQTESESPVAWRALASVLRRGERYLLVQTEKQTPTTIKEGELLPDGGKLIKITPKAFTILKDGIKHESTLTNQ